RRAHVRGEMGFYALHNGRDFCIELLTSNTCRHPPCPSSTFHITSQAWLGMTQAQQQHKPPPCGEHGSWNSRVQATGSARLGDENALNNTSAPTTDATGKIPA